ncbi:F0F1 ATP synthase subunit B [Qingshengfaniella alkalisoli]|uniref:ATP synthase subunit b n=1 Tax=Qingshengfaniella alkalisoli TaxID=2599296 RepID=A0A5B8I9N7_9RHOB|nr:F0F1 ATP synthase subunit B [Qingshengfaniella alkalisoli]QDY69736.1 F0F1 ATP synthase subunit B [Qingshengfaniella alkalisoli]
MRILSLIFAAGFATPALAASGPFFSLGNTDFVVLLAFLVFVGILVYFKVPSLIASKLDERSATIRSELDEARALREEAQSLLASYERKHKEVQGQADRIVDTARKEAVAAAEQAKKDLEVSIQRRLAAADDQIASAEAAAVKSVRDRAVAIAVAAAGDAIGTGMSKTDANALIDDSIQKIGEKLH